MEITKEELMAYTEAQIKTATALEKIADRLEDITMKQDTLITKFSNGFTSDMRETKAITASTNLCALKMHEDVKMVKILWTLLAAAIGLGLIVIEVMHKFAQ